MKKFNEFVQQISESAGDHHKEALNIVHAHSNKKLQKEPEAPRPDRHHSGGSVSASDHHKLHSSLTSAGYKHSQDKHGHTYSKGSTNVYAGIAHHGQHGVDVVTDYSDLPRK